MSNHISTKCDEENEATLQSFEPTMLVHALYIQVEISADVRNAVLPGSTVAPTQAGRRGSATGRCGVDAPLPQEPFSEMLRMRPAAEGLPLLVNPDPNFPHHPHGSADVLADIFASVAGVTHKEVVSIFTGEVERIMLFSSFNVCAHVAADGQLWW